ncbi:hypothetical protein IFT36_06540 [Frigoribacterium sp. CFBP 13605]|uniref:HNH endonuclease n=1 Tax=Frigoribacterium sp. CFBP 13605 TaxID=2774034 RepID=UPI001902D331|nr:hypothetical protein [Frigoribacterium sp. CFBP 13605]MBD8140204.1 hypothetical protein [Frigoribacterium sp. CFBP 13605]
MLYTYSKSSVTPTWFQDFVSAMVSGVLRARSEQVPASTWQAVLPAAHESELLGRRGLESRYEDLKKASLTLSPEDARQNLLATASSSFYEDVLSGAVDYRVSFAATAPFNMALKDLLGFSFKLLREIKNTPGDILSLRDELYRRAYEAMPEHVCPFCGLSTFGAPHPDMPREALDHYLSLSVYPLFGSHLPNLVPMCHACNSSFKLATDMLIADDGTPRVCVDPHGSQTAKISLANSEPFGNGLLPRWVIDFDPALDAFETWDQVFKIRLRYQENALNTNFKGWLDVFARWVKTSSVDVHDSNAVSVALSRWAAIIGGFDDRGFIKKPMFEMLASSALRPDDVGTRVTQFVQTLCAL